MKGKFELFAELPLEKQYEIVQWIQTSNLRNFVLTSKRHLNLFQPVLEVSKFLYFVVRGKYDAVQKMLRQDMNLLFRKGIITDCSSRTFENISGFEYALWALDTHMWTMMLDCLSQNENSKVVGTKLLSQYKQVRRNGIRYSLCGEKITEKHFDFKNTIIKEIEIQVNFFKAPGLINWDKADEQWKKGVGGAQLLLPMHAVYVYCSSIPFSHPPKLVSQLPKSMQFYNWLTKEDENWFCPSSKLGVEFAVYKELGGVDSLRGLWLLPLRLERDLETLKTLYDVEKIDFISFESQLEEQMTANTYPRDLPQI